MLLILNLFMQISYHSEFKTADEMIKQTAYSNMPDIDKEIIYLKDTDTNDIGDHIIPYNPRTIKNITLNGEITCTDTSAEWYCAGGGIYFELTDELGNSKLIHKEYKFNQGNTKITVDFTDNSDFICNEQPVATDITKVSQDRFLISIVWWTMSSASESTNNPDVKLNIDSIEIQYNEDASAASAQNYKVKICDFNDIYPSGILFLKKYQNLMQFLFYKELTDLILLSII